MPVTEESAVAPTWQDIVRGRDYWVVMARDMPAPTSPTSSTCLTLASRAWSILLPCRYQAASNFAANSVCC